LQRKVTNATHSPRGTCDAGKVSSLQLRGNTLADKSNSHRKHTFPHKQRKLLMYMLCWEVRPAPSTVFFLGIA